MSKNAKKVSDSELARFFLEKVEKDAIIPELFNLFGFDCLVRCSIDPNKLDGLIQQFEKSNFSDCETLSSIIGLIRQGKSTSDKQEKDLLGEIKDYVTEHLTEDISIESIAEVLHISYYYICHFFKQQTGLTLSAFRNQKRIENAIRMLIDTDEKISDIAALCGFNNVSYFTEIFTKSTLLSPTAFKTKNKNACFHPFYSYEDMLLTAKLGSVKFLEPPSSQLLTHDIATYSVHEPDEQFEFLHESAIMEYGGVLYASWYNCPKRELQGYTPICGKRSYNGGQTWTDIEIIADDKSGKILFCPPVYGVCHGKLYMLVNEMVAPDHIHAMDLYVLDNATDQFKFLWSRPIPFKLNTNVVTLPNGKLILPGRIAELDGFPNTPAVLISDSGNMDAEWRLIKVVENGDLPDGKKLVHPEVSILCSGKILYMFCRNDQRRVPLVYISKDFGESWSDAFAHDIPYVSSKIYGGMLSNGRNFLVANTYEFDRSKLVIYFSEIGTMHFEKHMVLFDRETSNMQGVTACHYPAAVESDGKLYVIATKNYEGSHRGAILFVIDLQDIELTAPQ